MEPNPVFAYLATDEQLSQTVKALGNNGFNVTVVDNGEEARQAALQLIPAGSAVFTMVSQTLESIGIKQDIDESDTYISVRGQLKALDSTQVKEKRELGAAPEYAIGSVHAITVDGQVLVASNTGSQMPAYAYAADKVIWVVGTQKIVNTLDEGFQRIYEYSFPLENERSKVAYGSPSAVSKILLFNQEIQPDRINIILVEEKLGF